MSERDDVAQRVMDTILKLIEKTNLPPWRAGWDIGLASVPINAISKKPYRGINPWILLASSIIGGYKDPRWLTFRQTTTRGGLIRSGEKGTVIVFWKMWKKKEEPDPDDPDEEEKVRFIPLMKEYIVYNADQTIGCSLPELNKGEMHNHDPIREAESIIQGMPKPPKIVFQGQPAYNVAIDSVTMPPIGAWDKPEDYYSTMFHELSHSTAHPKRLKRFSISPTIASSSYYQEEIVAEMGAAMLSAYAGISPTVVQENAAYIKHYVDLIKSQPNVVIRAGQQAQKAVDYVLDELPVTQEEKKDDKRNK